LKQSFHKIRKKRKGTMIMPSFDIVSEVDNHELSNSVANANRELTKRFDFRGVDAGFEQQENTIKIFAEIDYQLEQLYELLQIEMVKRKIDIRCLERKDPEKLGKNVLTWLTVRQGIESLTAKQMVKLVKGSKLKVQTAIQGDKLRVTGKKRDDLQKVMALLRESDIDIPLQFNNFRD
jgi:uncharacterized protein YajQ (UPF0234 family)